MTPKYQIGQKVVITPVKTQQLSPRDAALEPYAGQIGKVADYYWISLGSGGGIFYIYTVLVEADQKELVVHEDELEAVIE
jgi:hypothetical protein